MINCFVVVIDRFAPLQLHVVQEMKQTDKGKTKRNDKEKKEGKEKSSCGYRMQTGPVSFVSPSFTESQSRIFLYPVINENEEKLKDPLF